MPYLSLMPPNVQIVLPWHWVGLELTWWLALYWPDLSLSSPCQNLGTSPPFLFGIDFTIALDEA